MTYGPLLSVGVTNIKTLAQTNKQGRPVRRDVFSAYHCLIVPTSLKYEHSLISAAIEIVNMPALLYETHHDSCGYSKV